MFPSCLLVGTQLVFCWFFTTSMRMWQCSFCHFTPKTWISWAGPLILLCFMPEPAFRRIWVIFPLSQKIPLPCCYIQWCHQRTAGVLKPHCFPVQPGSVHGRGWGCASTHGGVNSSVLHVPPDESKLHSAARGVEKNTLAMSTSHIILLERENPLFLPPPDEVHGIE